MITVHAPAVAAAPPLVGRRGFLVGAGATLALAFGARTLLDGPPSVGSVDAVTDELSLATLAPLVGSTFAVHTGAFGTVALTLVAADPAQSPVGGVQPISGDAFSLLFSGPAATRLPDGVHRMRHADMSLPPVFMSKVGRGVHAQDYQVVVDRRTFPRSSTQTKAG